ISYCSRVISLGYAFLICLPPALLTHFMTVGSNFQDIKQALKGVATTATLSTRARISAGTGLLFVARTG
ncbi:MAG: hypothetical protein FWC89_10470, partial [Defluviitaleaceae bacterium]|nr:hypothetical protein [Defluviitaleaceae bacterium]